MSTRSSKATADGMSGLPYAPFPAFNPWNWGALTPMRMMIVGMEAAHMSLHAWRNFADAYRAALRQQQDAFLDDAEARLCAADETAARKLEEARSA